MSLGTWLATRGHRRATKKSWRATPCPILTATGDTGVIDRAVDGLNLSLFSLSLRRRFRLSPARDRTPLLSSPASRVVRVTVRVLVVTPVVRAQHVAWQGDHHTSDCIREGDWATRDSQREGAYSDPPHCQGTRDLDSLIRRYTHSFAKYCVKGPRAVLSHHPNAVNPIL